MMKEVLAALRTEQKRLAKELKKVEGLLAKVERAAGEGRSGSRRKGGGKGKGKSKGRGRRKAAGKAGVKAKTKTVTKTKAKAGASSSPRPGVRRSTATSTSGEINRELDKVDELKRRKAERLRREQEQE